MVHDARPNASSGTSQRKGVNVGVFQCFPSSLQQHALLRVHQERIIRRNAKEDRVEFGGSLQESPMCDIRLSRTTSRIEDGHVPTTVSWYRADTFSALAH